MNDPLFPLPETPNLDNLARWARDYERQMEEQSGVYDEEEAEGEDGQDEPGS